MLYLTTRNKTDSYTAHRVLHSQQPPGGGYFVPFHLPVFTEEELSALKELSFSDTVARILNLFFGGNISGWDIDFAVGRQAVKLVNMSHRIFVLESWHNHEGSHKYFVKRLHQIMRDPRENSGEPGAWFCTAVEIALLFAWYGCLLRRDITRFNVALPAGDMQRLLSVRYAQQMGLPVYTVALGAEESEDLWEFIYHGKYSTRREVLPTGLEQLIYLHFGMDGVKKYLLAVENKRQYHLSEEELQRFADGLFTSVVGANRVQSVISSVKRSCNYNISPDAACAYGALQDCRVRGAGGMDAVLLSFLKPE